MSFKYVCNFFYKLIILSCCIHIFSTVTIYLGCKIVFTGCWTLHEPPIKLQRLIVLNFIDEWVIFYFNFFKLFLPIRWHYRKCSSHFVALRWIIRLLRCLATTRWRHCLKSVINVRYISANSRVYCYILGTHSNSPDVIIKIISQAGMLTRHQL